MSKRRTIPTQRVMYVYDPDPDPSPGLMTIFAIIAVVGGLALWTNPGVLNNLMVMFNPEIAEYEEKKREDMLNTLKWIAIIVAIIGGILLLVWWSSRRKRRR